MHLALPKQKTLVDQIQPAIIAAILLVAGVVLIPVRNPVEVTNGNLSPSAAAPGDNIAVRWTQDWHERCPVTVSREFIGADGFKKTAEPYIYGPPKKLGASSYSGSLTLPLLPPGEAYYHAILQPRCWIDRIYQREYSTPFVKILVLPQKPPAGPR